MRNMGMNGDKDFNNFCHGAEQRNTVLGEGAEHGTSLEYLGDFPGCPVVKTLHFHCR